MAQRDKEEAIAQMTRAIRGLEKAIDKLDRAFDFALLTQKRKLFKLITSLEARLETSRAFVRHLQAAEVVVNPPARDSYKRLEKALAALQAVEVKSGAVTRVLRVASALGNAARTTRSEVSSRAT